MQALSEVTWAAILAESCLKKTCRNLTRAVDHKGLKGKWIEQARQVLESAQDRAAAAKVGGWLDQVDQALEERNKLLHSDRTQVVWSTPDGVGVPDGTALYHWKSGQVTYLDAQSLRALAQRLSRCIEGWEDIHATASRIRTVADLSAPIAAGGPLGSCSRSLSETYTKRRTKPPKGRST